MVSRQIWSAAALRRDLAFAGHGDRCGRPALDATRFERSAAENLVDLGDELDEVKAQVTPPGRPRRHRLLEP